MKRDLFKARVSFNSVWQQRICHASQFCMAIVDILTGVGRDELYPPLDAMWFRRSVMCPDISLDPIWAVCLKSVGDPIIDRSILGLTRDWFFPVVDPPGTQQVKHCESQDDSDEFIPTKFRAIQLVIMILIVDKTQLQRNSLVITRSTRHLQDRELHCLSSMVPGAVLLFSDWRNWINFD